MKVSLNWLKDYLELDDISFEDIIKTCNLHINEVEAAYKVVDVTHLEIGHVIECIPHPDSDHLHICQVELSDGVRQIVCGAPNVDKDKYVIVALPGCQLPGGTIKPSKVRGVESNGMCCSLQELGIEEKYIYDEFKNGIYLLNDDAKVGGNPLEYLGLDDYVIDLELTSNRSDLLSIEGVAYDLGAALKKNLTHKVIKVDEIDEENPVEVQIETDKCFQYYARYIKDVEIKKSPNWMSGRLIASGIRPINNVVDITNYVLMEYGQPLHSFDADKLGNKIVVRNAYQDEVMTTLDEIERKLEISDIVITDGTKPVCLGGVMGGLNTDVEENTKNIILEAAMFDPLSIRKTSSRLNLHSESSVRFERKVDQNRTLKALEYASMLLTRYANGKVLKGVASVVNIAPYEKHVEITLDYVNHFLGTSLNKEELTDLFDDLEYDYIENNGIYTINIPSRRMDLEASKQDICEDIARMYGYDNIPTTLPKTNDKGSLTYKQSLMNNTRRFFSGMGLNECITYSLIHQNKLNDFTLEERDSIKPLMPLTEDHAVMRQSILNGLVDAIKYNRFRKVTDMAFYEIGEKYYTDKEVNSLALAITGTYDGLAFKGIKVESSFYVLKGILDNYFDSLNLTATYEACETLNKNFHPYASAKIIIDGVEIGFIATLHPKYLKEEDLADTYVAEINFDELVKISQKGFVYKSLSKYPSVTRDLAIVVDKNVTNAEIETIIRQVAKKNLASLEIFDVYMGENIPKDKKSMAYKINLACDDHTMDSDEAQKIVGNIIKRLAFVYQATIRE